MTDVRLAYLVANKVPLTEEELRTLILRVFAAHFCETEEGYETAVIGALVTALHEYRTAAAIRAAEENEDDKPVIEELSEPLNKTDAELYYIAVLQAAYRKNGFDEVYAAEASSWPDVLPLDAPWDKETLAALAHLEIGHDLLSMDVVRQMHEAAQRTKVKA